MSAPINHDAIFRASHIGGSEVAALFNASPWLTEFELWHRKKGNIDTPEFNSITDDGVPDDERIYWGVKLEAVIADAAKERFGYIDRIPASDALPLSNGMGLGGHPDGRVICPDRGPGIIEVKMADWLVRKQWGKEPPLQYLLQGTTYAGLDQCEWFDFLVLVGGNKLERFKYDFRPKLFGEIERRVEVFWRSIDENRPPKPDYGRDGKVVSELFDDPADSTIDLRGDNLAAIAAADYMLADSEMKQAEKRREAAKVELLEKIGNNTVGLADGFIVNATRIAAISDRVAAPGEIIKGRRAYRRFSVKKKELL